MPERDGYIPGVPCWVDTNQPDPEASLDFYRGLFGWELEDVMPEGAPGSYFRPASVAGTWPPSDRRLPARRRGRRGTPTSGSTTPRRRSPRHARPAARGRSPSTSWTRGGWRSSSTRRSGVLRLAGGDKQGGPGRQRARLPELQQPRHPRSRGGQGVLRRRVRWDTLALPGMPMWTLPGYGDHLEEGSPGLREQMAQMGGPDGFIDVVAAINPIAADDADTRAHGASPSPSTSRHGRGQGR